MSTDRSDVMESSGLPLRRIDWFGVEPLPRLRLVLVSLVGACLAFVCVRASFGFGGSLAARLSSVYLYDGAIFLASLLCLLRGLLDRHERAAWLFFSGAIAAWGVGALLDAAVHAGETRAPFPWPANAGYLCFYVFAGAALVLLGRSSFERFSAPLLLDGAITAVTVASFVTAIGLPAVIRSNGDSSSAVLGLLAHPILDSLLLTLAVTIVVLNGLRPGLDRALVAAGLAIFALTDAIYSSQAPGAASGHVIEVGRLIPLVLIGAVSCLPRTERAPTPGVASGEWVAVVAPTTFAFAAFVLIAYGRFQHLGDLPLTLARAAVALAFIRLFVSFAANQRLLSTSRADAISDELTGLGNRRALIADSSALFQSPNPEPHVLAIYDLDGFKQYNDTFGHPAGDALLSRLGLRFEAAVAGRGNVYRLGGDEFCLLAATAGTDADTLIAEAARGLVEHGDRVAVRASYGAAVIPAEARDLSEALRLADLRMYAEKGRSDLALR
jgi:diguanylate cyclase (GGDEF)-like protein